MRRFNGSPPRTVTSVITNLIPASTSNSSPEVPRPPTEAPRLPYHAPKATVAISLTAPAVKNGLPGATDVSVPPVSGGHREQMVRHVKRLGEEAKVAVRSIRQEVRKQIAVRGRGSERAVQEATEVAVAEGEKLVKAKGKEMGA